MSKFDLRRALVTAFLLCISLLAICNQAIFAEVATDGKPRWAIALHGGAGNLPRSMGAEREKQYADALEKALSRGKAILSTGGTALDAVEATVVELEDSYLFNAGKGAAFNFEGRHELDASIMDGATLRCGGIAIVTQLKNPVTAARLVMEKTPHVLLAGPRGEQFAKSHGCKIVDQSYYYTEQRFAKLQKRLEQRNLPMPTSPGYDLNQATENPKALTPLSGDSGTVGCVALDSHGNLAAATSTGGLTGKIPGRVGDSPINGAGNYANSEIAVCCTGRGEEFIRHTIAARVAWLVESEKFDLDQAVEHCLTQVLKEGDGGLIAVDRAGNLLLRTTTSTLPSCVADSNGLFEVRLWFDEL